MSDPQAAVERYITMWNETDAARRRELVAETVTDDATYLDPMMSGEGIDGITAMIGAAQQQLGGLRFRLAAGPDAHHDCVRFTWTVGDDANPPAAVGVDFAELAQDGRMRRITGFLEAAQD